MRDVQKSKPGAETAAPHIVENDIHGVVAYVLPRIARDSCRTTRLYLEVGEKTGRAARNNRFPSLVSVIAPSVDCPGLDSQTATLCALAQSQDHVGLMFLHGLQELALPKTNGKDDFSERAAPWEPLDNLLGDIFFELPVGPKAVDEEPHR